MEPRTLAATHCLAAPYLYNAECYSFVQAIVDCDDADILMPELPSGRVRKDIDQVLGALRRRLDLGGAPRLAASRLERDYDLFVYIASLMSEIPNLRRIRGWRQRSRKAVCYLINSWHSEIHQFRSVKPILDQFDAVFTSTKSSVEALQALTTARVAYIPLAVDALSMAPVRLSEPRVIDAYSMGRRSDFVHHQLKAEMAAGRMVYVYDTVPANVKTRNFEEHIQQRNHLLQRTKFLPCFSIQAFASHQLEIAKAQDTVPHRFYEGAATGTVMVGARPQNTDFETMFDWPDALIEMAADHRDVPGFLRQLDADTVRMASARRANVVNTLRRHDFVYRWERMRACVGAAPSSKLELRKARLRARADELQALCASTEAVIRVGETAARSVRGVGP